jgi:DNA polymerase-2
MREVLRKSAEGILFDVYNLEDQIYIWILQDKEPRMICFRDQFFPKFYIGGPSRTEEKFIDRLVQLNALREVPQKATKIDFYENKEREVWEISLQIPSVLRTIYQKLYAFYERLDIYHSDVEIPFSYLTDKSLFPLCRVRVDYRLDAGSSEKPGEIPSVESITCLSDIHALEYTIPEFRFLNIGFLHNHRIGYSPENPLVFFSESGYREELSYSDPRDLLTRINQILEARDPDIILSAFGDQAILPFLFDLSQKHKIPLKFDREKTPITRRIVTQGSTYNTYGQIVYRAPSYPLFGRWHIDSANSFVYKESYLHGVLELARLSRLPVQTTARASTGKALTCIEMTVAWNKNYLVPWQKSALERAKTAYELLNVDKGGLVCLPDKSYGSILENVFQLDFAQMYPTIMAKYNISPETVNCPCCTDRLENLYRIPGTGYHVCAKRRGVVSDALEEILDRRKYYKDKIESPTTEKETREILQARQNSLKWMLVTSFGYLGYRNAKFGRIESHEAVTAIGRDVLLRAKEIAEDSGYIFLHGITDCVFLVRPDFQRPTASELKTLCDQITEDTRITLKWEATYDWLVFPSSKQDSQIGVANRYFGKYSTGGLKLRGIFLRRKDIPELVKRFQEELLSILERASSVKELKESSHLLNAIYDRYALMLYDRNLDFRLLLSRRTVTKFSEDYKVQNSSMQSLGILKSEGIQVDPGEKIKFLVSRGPKKKRIYLPEELVLRSKKQYPIHIDYYRELLIQAMEEVTEHLFSPEYFRSLREKQLLLPFPQIPQKTRNELTKTRSHL